MSDLDKRVEELKDWIDGANQCHCVIADGEECPECRPFISVGLLIDELERLRRIAAAVDALDADADALPEGTEDVPRGSSTYNWIKYCVRRIRAHAATPADMERACEIVRKCTEHGWELMGLKAGRALSLADYSLAELLEANHLMAADRGAPLPSGHRTLAVHCDDRLVAALYTATHFPGSPTKAGAEPVAVADGKAVVVVTIPDQEDDDTGE